MKYLVRFFISLFLINPSYAIELLTQYSCDSEKDAIECNSKCRINKFDDYHSQISFDVNVEKNLVMWTLYDKNKKYGNGIEENCKVINSRNWICQDPIWAFYSKSIMSNGIYTSINYEANCRIDRDLIKQICKNPKAKSFSCAK